MNLRNDETARRMTEFADQPDEAPAAELVVPEDLGTLSNEELSNLHTRATDAFDAVYADGQGLSPEDLEALQRLTEVIETLLTEVQGREAEQEERDMEAQAMAAKVRGPQQEAAVEQEAPTEEMSADDEPVAEPVQEPESKEIRVNLARARRATPPAEAPQSERTMRDIMRAADVPGFSAGQGMDWNDVGRAVDRRLASFNHSQYAAASRSGNHLREQHGIAVIQRPFEESLVVNSADPLHVEEVIRRAVDESRLPGGSLTAAGGWCAPSETIYDLFEIESRDGLFSLPEIGVSRGGINFTPGPDFASIFSSATGWNYTEAEDIAGDYNGAGGGTKPVYVVPCPDFTEKRLDIYGLAIQAGLLQSKGYPEVIARTVRGALIAHDHGMSKQLVDSVVAGSTAVTMTAAQVGATAPLLDAIEIQVEHYRYIHRLARSSTLEAVFPYWVRGVLRSDLARRTGVDMLDVPDARIDAWFSQRGIAPQYIYNFQDITGAAGSFVTWPTSVDFLLYAAGTWVKGGADVLTLDTIYDSVLLGTNDYTALWTEEGWLTAKVGHDSRVITAPLDATGATHIGADILHNGTEAPAV